MSESFRMWNVIKVSVIHYTEYNYLSEIIIKKKCK